MRLYYTHEARESAIEKITDLKAVLSTIPGDVLGYTDATEACRYLTALQMVIRDEDKKETRR